MQYNYPLLKATKKKGISSIGWATVLHTEGWVFESPIPYMRLLIFFLFLLLLLLLIVLHVGSISFFGDLLAFYNRIKPYLFVKSVIIYFFYPIKAILSTVNPLLPPPLFYGVIAYIYLVVRSFCLQGRLPGWQTSLVRFTIWFIILLITWVSGCNSIMFFVLSSLLIYIGLDLHCFNSIFCNMAPYDERHKSIKTTIADELSYLNQTINTSAKSLRKSNNRF